ncbi:ABC transporter permease [Stenomitos frigidus]|uniref:Transport permease protein n=1 Tax=Stenomitos frigidus ULC18 TaxID=2107698 RepID=A0A2T1EAB1_9CYAN|nr:ABC transporter permease [Stenomitos frigidus]PSB29648.1 ABC transporter permease [Stenomitos frigidus ULC18]
MAISIQKNLSRSEAQRYWELLRVLVERNLSARYRGSVLGVFWSLLNPLTMTGLYTAIFGGVFATQYYGSLFGYAMAAFTGLTIINFFSAATSQALTSVVGNGPLLNKIRLPVSVFPVAVNAANVFQFLVGPMPLLAIVTVVNVRHHVLTHLAAPMPLAELVATIVTKSLINLAIFPLPLLALTLVCLGAGFLVSALFVFFRDLPYFYELVIFVLWISSPVFYPASIVPAHVRPLLELNPLFPIIECTRQIVLSGEPPDVSMLVRALVSSVVIFGLGWSCFRWWRPQFMDLL